MLRSNDLIFFFDFAIILGVIGFMLFYYCISGFFDMCDTTLIYIVRHGESLGNLHKICLGHTDLGLTERGREQAAATAKALASVNFCRIYSSDLVRAVETALPHAEIRGLSEEDILRSYELRELYFGDWENAAVEDLKRDYGDMFTVGWRQNFGTFTPPRGESVQGCAERMHRELVKIGRENLGGTVLVVSHAASIRALWGKILHLPAEEVCAAVQFPSNASYSTLKYDFSRDTLEPVDYSVDAHLAELRTALPG